VLQITVDGLRADLLTRYQNQLADDGFLLLRDQGTSFSNVHYQHANTETIVGHATLATGAQPAVHGMTGNVWFDEQTGELAYNIEDAAAPILPVRDETMSGDQVDPAQQLARTAGRSPRALLAETFTDSLYAHSKRQARVFAVSGKDRGAVALAGQHGKAFWMSSDSGDFVTSAYYYDAYPRWVADWNAERKASKFAGQQWQLMHDISQYQQGHLDDRPWETDLRGYGRVFPHSFGEADNKLLYTQVIASPQGDRLTADFAKILLTSEKLGEDSIPDYLSVSFSGLDAVNHFFGPSSLETEDMLLQLDRTLADLFGFIDIQLGLDNVLIVLSADHGMAETPEFMAQQGIEAGRLTTDVVFETAERLAREIFNTDGLVKYYYRPFIYLDDKLVSNAGLEKAAVSDALAEAMMKIPGVALTISRAGIDQAPASKLIEQIRNNIHPARSGDIYLVQARYWFNFDKGPVTAMHGSPWEYDTHVPLMFFGASIANQTIDRPVHPVDVVPTLSALLGISPPDSSQGSVLNEVPRRDQ
jgi:predicted AlkP superfamily pyrophosphatase or phosphodiesterase